MCFVLLMNWYIHFDSFTLNKLIVFWLWHDLIFWILNYHSICLFVLISIWELNKKKYRLRSMKEKKRKKCKSTKFFCTHLLFSSVNLLVFYVLIDCINSLIKVKSTSIVFKYFIHFFVFKSVLGSFSFQLLCWIYTMKVLLVRTMR